MRNERLISIADEFEKPLASRVKSAFLTIRSAVSLSALKKMMETGSPEVVREIELSQRASGALIKSMAGSYNESVLTTPFTDLGGDIERRAKEFLEKRSAFAIREINDETRKGIRRIITKAYTGSPSEWHPTEAAWRIKSIIGLTERQALAVDNFYSRMVKSGLSVLEAKKKSERYADNMLSERALGISRTETMTAINTARREAYEFAADSGLLDRNLVEREWFLMEDEATCQECRDFDGAKAKLGENFTSINGDESEGPPAHNKCRCSELFTVGM